MNARKASAFLLKWQENSPDSVLCAECGVRAGKHRGSDGKCPAQANDPSLMVKALMTREEWIDLDKRVRAAWNVRTTHFRAVSK